MFNRMITAQGRNDGKIKLLNLMTLNYCAKDLPK
jgi:hypothetical protein